MRIIPPGQIKSSITYSIEKGIFELKLKGLPTDAAFVPVLAKAVNEVIGQWCGDVLNGSEFQSITLTKLLELIHREENKAYIEQSLALNKDMH